MERRDDLDLDNSVFKFSLCLSLPLCEMGLLEPRLHGDGGFRGVSVKGQHSARLMGTAVSEWWFCFLAWNRPPPEEIRLGGGSRA